MSTPEAANIALCSETPREAVKVTCECGRVLFQASADSKIEINGSWTITCPDCGDIVHVTWTGKSAENLGL